MSLVPSLLQAIVQLDGEALVMHVGDKPYVVSPTGQVDLASRGLSFEAVVGVVNQLLPVESQQALDEFGAAEYRLPPMPEFPDEHFTIVAARGGDDVWAEVRRRKISDDDRVPMELFGPTVEQSAPGYVDARDPLDAQAPQASAIVSAPTVSEDDDLFIPGGEQLFADEIASEPPVASHASEDDLGLHLLEEQTRIVEAPAEVLPPPAFAPPPRTTPTLEHRAVAAAPSTEEPRVAGPAATEFITPPPSPPAAFVPPVAPEPRVSAPPAALVPPPEPLPSPPAAFVPPALAPEPHVSAPPAALVPPMPALEPRVSALPAPFVPPMPAPEPRLPVPPAALVPPIPSPEPRVWAPPTAFVPPIPAAEPRVSAPPTALVPPMPAAEPRVSAPLAAFVPPMPAPEPRLPALSAAPVPPMPAPEPRMAAPISPAPEPRVVAPPPPPPPVFMPAASASQWPSPSSFALGGSATQGAWEAPEPRVVAPPPFPPAAASSQGGTPPPAVVLPLARNPIRSDAPPPLAEQALAGLDRLLRLAAARGASTLYLSSASRPSVRVDGDIYTLDGAPVLAPNDVESLLLTLMPERSAEALRTGVASEWICDLPDVGRVRCMSFRDHRGPGGVFRIMPSRAVTADQLGLSRDIQALAVEPEGLLLVSGPRSSGKRTLMSAFVDLINRTRRDHVISIESEINIVHERSGSFISQREVRGGIEDMVAVARAALREDPDILMLEELRSPALMDIALDAAGAGQLVIGGIPAHDAPGAIDRIIDLYPPEHRRQVQLSLAQNLRGVVAQVLLRKTTGGRVAAREVLLNTPAVAGVLAEGRTSQLPLAIEGGRRQGMVPLNDALVGFVQSGVVDVREAYGRAADRAGFLALLKRQGVDTSAIDRYA